MCVTELANPELVCKSVSHDDTGTSLHQSQQKSSRPTKSSTGNTSNLAKNKPYNLPLVREKLERYDLSADAKEIIMASWRPGTSKQYKTYLDKWQVYCKEQQIDVIKPGLENAIEFLVSLYHL
ncbi:Hypothetical predicted protein, partial [Paramuricea clavata]